jgi:hypothetical protein
MPGPRPAVLLAGTALLAAAALSPGGPAGAEPTAVVDAPFGPPVAIVPVPGT